MAPEDAARGAGLEGAGWALSPEGAAQGVAREDAARGAGLEGAGWALPPEGAAQGVAREDAAWGAGPEAATVAGGAGGKPAGLDGAAPPSAAHPGAAVDCAAVDCAALDGAMEESAALDCAAVDGAMEDAAVSEGAEVVARGQNVARAARGAAPGNEARQETALAREIRARSLVAGMAHAEIAEAIHDECAPVAGTSWIRAYRLALGISLADVVAQVRARYASEGRAMPRFSETLLSAYESNQKRPGPEYLHYLCSVYRAEPAQLGYPDHCFCGRSHREPPARPGGRGGGDGADARRSAQHAVSGQDAAPGPAGAREPGTGHGLGAGLELTEGCPGDSWSAGCLPDRARLAQRADGEGVSLADRREAEDEDDQDVLRAALMRMISHGSASVDGQFLGAVDRIRRRVDDALVKGTVSATMLDQWEETTAGYGRQYMTMPPLRLICDVLLDLADVRRMCEQRQPLEFTERLCRLVGQLAGLAGVVMIDVGDQRLARSFFRTARSAADETGDRHLRSWVAAREALVPLYYGDPREACGLARTASGLAGSNPCVAGAMGPVLEARSLARAAADRDSAARRPALRRASQLLGQAHDVFDRLPASEREDTVFGYTERQLLFHEGDTLVSLGHHEAADAAFRRAMLLYSPQEVLDRSLVSLGIARCRLEANEPEEALRLSRETLLGVPREHRSQIMVRVARSLGDSVAARHGEFRGVRDYREAVPAG